MGPSAVHPIEFDGLVKRFGSRTVLDELSFVVPEGSIVGLLGPNGAGKSTAMRVLLGLQRASAGSVRVMGHEPGSAGFREAVKGVGTIIETPPVYKSISALENLRIRAAALGLRPDESELRDLLRTVGLAERAGDKAGGFSLGMRQRLGIALALTGEPKIVVLDEPTNGLDPEGAVEIRELIADLPRRGTTVLVCTHRLDEIEKTCDYVVLIRGGKLVTQGSLAEVIASASGGGLHVRVAAAEVERAVGLIETIDAGEVHFTGELIRTSGGVEHPAAVTRVLAEQGIYLAGLAENRKTLEQAFLELTRDVEEGRDES